MWKEFKNFAIKGNVIDLAIGIIIGVTFTAIVNSLVNDIIDIKATRCPNCTSKLK